MSAIRIARIDAPAEASPPPIDVRDPELVELAGMFRLVGTFRRDGDRSQLAWTERLLRRRRIPAARMLVLWWAAMRAGAVPMVVEIEREIAARAEGEAA